jgi:lipoprotein-anchoring transpeptidase ErfK/SrfK
MSRPRTVAVVAVSSLIPALLVTLAIVVLAPSPAETLSGTVHAAGSASAAPSTPPATPSATPTPTAPPVPAVCAATAPGVNEIYVSISQQHLWACAGPSLFVEGAVTTGASALTNVHYATPLGLARIHSKTRNVVLRGHDVNGAWNDPVHFWMPFNGGDGFHDAPWQTFPLGSPLYTTQGSHGCVHVAYDVIAKLYDWAQVGTLVDIRA